MENEPDLDHEHDHENNLEEDDDINETEEITVFGQTGIYANKSEIVNWKGEKSINEYPINEDNEPEVNKSI